jgi:hypothetical protein
MKKLIAAATVLLTTTALSGQNPLKANLNQFDDTIVLKGEKIGHLAELQVFSGSSATHYNVSLYRDVTKKEKATIVAGYTQGKANAGRVNFAYQYQFDGKQEKAGHFLFEAGTLRKQAMNLYLTAGIVAVAGTVLNGIVAANAGTGSSSPLIPAISLSTSGVLSIVALVKNYRAHAKLRQAGVTLQRR